MNLSSLSKSILFSGLVAIGSLSSVAYFYSSGIQINPLMFYGLIATAVFSLGSIFFSIRTARFIAYVSDVCKAIRVGDFEQRVINRHEKGNLGLLADSTNNAIDISDAYVRDSMLAMKAAGEGKYYRKIRPEGMNGAFLVGVQGINNAINMLAEKDIIETKNRNMMNITISEINNMVDEASKGNLTQRIDVDKFEDEFKDLVTRMNNLMDTILEPINETIGGLRAFAKGDLTSKVNADRYQGSFNEMMSSLNETIAQIQDMVGKIQSAALAINSASTEISKGGQDLSARTEQQASSLEETSAAMEELTGTVKQNSENAQQANTLSSDASQIASEGGSVVQDAISAMSQIQESSKKIGYIIDVIDEIAFQTNLLSLNAAVEAARAGEAGRGFAVVASEVGALASRSASASKEIKELIGESSVHVNKGSKLVDQSGESLKNIEDSIKEATILVSEIALASKQQASGLDEINRAVLQMDKGTQQNASLVEENMSATRSLVSQANALSDLMGFFKTDGGSSSKRNSHDIKVPPGIIGDINSSTSIQ